MVIRIYGISKYRYIQCFSNMCKCVSIRDSVNNMNTPVISAEITGVTSYTT